MASINEAARAGTPLATALAAGLNDISYNQTVRFWPYVRLVMPLDGMVFWVNASLVSAKKLKAFNLCQSSIGAKDVKCAVHASTDTIQNYDESLDMSSLVVTTTQEVRPFHDAVGDVLWMGDFEGIKFAINTQSNYYAQAGLHHYVGATIYPAMMTQFIDTLEDLDTSRLIISNSLPLWIALFGDAEKFVWLPQPVTTLFPAFLVTDNLTPPYIVIDVKDGETIPLQAGALLSSDMSRAQLARDTVEITTYGLGNDQIMDLMDFVVGACLAPDLTGMGVTNMPVARDVKRTQAEANILAQKKSVTFEVNYYQSSTRDMAERYILSCIPNVTFSFEGQN